MSTKTGKSHTARKDLFAKGIRQGYLTTHEIEQALPNGVMTPSERWLLYYSLHAARVEVLDRRGKRVELEDLRSSRDELQGVLESH